MKPSAFGLVCNHNTNVSATDHIQLSCVVIVFSNFEKKLKRFIFATEVPTIIQLEKHLFHEHYY